MRYSIRLSYNGAAFSGWQIQPNAPSVQECLQNALSILLHGEIIVTGAGRTDTKVNAVNYMAHFETGIPVQTDALCYKLNAMLPSGIAVHEVAPAASDFHAMLSKEFRVITLDLRGQGNSSKCSGGNTVRRNAQDIREPMNAIIGFTSLAASCINQPDKVKEYLKKIAISSEHLLSLINDVLDMSRIESGKVKIEEQPLHLPELIHDLHTIIQTSVASKQLDFLLDTVDVVDEDIITDKLRLTQILLNILSNGVKYNKTGGMLALRIKQEKSAPAGYATYHFIIKDTGIGISHPVAGTLLEFSQETNA